MGMRLVAPLLVLALAGCTERPPVVGAEPVEARATRTITVQGRAAATSPPRIARFVATVGVWSSAPDLALREAELTARRVRGQLENAGVRATDLVDERRSLQVRPYATSLRAVLPEDESADGDPDDGASEDAGAAPEDGAVVEPSMTPVIELGAPGYLATEAIEVTVRSQGSLGKVLDRALSFGARVGEVVWSPNNPDVLVEKVRQKAVQDARARAQVLAQELAQAVGQANSIVELELVEPGGDPRRPYEARCEVRIEFTLRSY